MIYLAKLHCYMDDTIQLKSVQELKNLTTKKYYNYVKSVFVENQTNYGQGEAEAIDTFHAQPFPNVEKWLVKSGFDLENGFRYDSGK